MWLFEQWWLYVILYLIFAVVFNQVYKVATQKIKRAGALTVLLQTLAGVVALVFIPVFGWQLPTNAITYVLLAVACCFYAVSDRMTTDVRSQVEASTFSVIKQLSTAFLIVAGLVFMGEPVVATKIIGAVMIIGSNILLFFQPKTFAFDKGFLLGVVSQIIFTVALFTDVNISGQFNIPFYVAVTLIVPSLLICIFERITPKQLKEEFVDNKKPILITAAAWGPMIIVMLVAYNLGQVSVVAPIAAITAILNVFVGYFLLKEHTHLLRKIIASVVIIGAIFLINM
jgi:drug/metabolite transporter (DMT)-like permease